MSYAPQGPGPVPSQPGPYPGNTHPYASAQGQPSPQLQAAWRFSARRKNDTTAWLLWIGGPFLIGLPIHDFYFGAIGKGLAKIGLLIMIFVFFMGGIIAGAATESTSGSTGAFPVLFGGGLLLAGLSFLAVVIWWIMDGVTMSRRLETTNDRIRHQIAAEQGVDPWSF